MELYNESMTKVVFNLQAWFQITIRCWREETNYNETETDSQNVEDIIKALKEIKKDDATKMSIANHLIKLDRMNAVEVLDQQGSGPVVYKDWP